MKRKLILQEDASPTPFLLPELFVEVARASDWVCAGPLARCSKQMLRLFTSANVLRRIMNWITSHPGERLFCWLCFALPAEWLDTTGTLSLLPRDLHVQGSLLQLLPRASDFLVTGGHMCARLYDTYWAADVDVFVPHEATPVPDTRTKVETSTEMLDLVPSWSQLLQCELDCFDMSIVQQGVTRDGTFWRTPLSLYTQQASTLVAFPDEENVFYNSDWPGPRHSTHELLLSWADLWSSIEAHDTPQQRFHEWGLQHCDDDSATWRWCKRVQKYCERFGLFSIVYCRPPARRRWPLTTTLGADRVPDGPKQVPVRRPPIYPAVSRL